ALGLVGALGAAAIYGIGAFLVVDGNISAGTLVALAALVTRVYSPLTGLTNARVDLMTAMVSFERVFEVLDAPEGITDRPGAIDLIDPRGLIEFNNVTFRYPTAAEVTVPSLEAPNALLGQDPLGGIDPEAVRRDRREPHRRRSRRPRPDAGKPPFSDRRRHAGSAPV